MLSLTLPPGPPFLFNSRLLLRDYSAIFVYTVAELYNLSAYDTVTVTKINKHHHDEVLKHVSTDFMMVTIKDQFISRGEMFHYQNSLLGKWIFCGERLTSQDVSVKVYLFVSVVLFRT